MMFESVLLGFVERAGFQTGPGGVRPDGAGPQIRYELNEPPSGG